MLLSEVIEKLQSIQEMNPKAEVYVQEDIYAYPIKGECIKYDATLDCVIEINL